LYASAVDTVKCQDVSVCLRHSCIVSKRLNPSSISQRQTKTNVRLSKDSSVLAPSIMAKFQ